MKPALAGVTPKIQLGHVKKSFGTKEVLRGVDLAVEPEKSLVIIGGSGSGKSVMLKCILGLLSPDEGSILIDGRETIGSKARDRNKMMRKFGMLFQGGALFDSLKVWENVAFGLIQVQKMNRRDAHEIAIQKLRQVGLAPNRAICIRRSFPAACKNASGWPALSPLRRRLFSSMSRPPDSTPSWRTSLTTSLSKM